MAEFVRARTSEQKAQRLEQIKEVAKAQFSCRPYHEITLTTIADELGWSRANLYKYITTKEEIFLLIMGDMLAAYMDALLAAFPQGCGFDAQTIAQVWGGIASAHKDMFRYGNLLIQVIETNVTVEKLADFKGGYYQELALMEEQLPNVLGVRKALLPQLVNDVYYHGIGLAGSCHNNPLVKEALKSIGIKPATIDFKGQMTRFVGMCLDWYQKQ